MMLLFSIKLLKLKIVWLAFILEINLFGEGVVIVFTIIFL